MPIKKLYKYIIILNEAKVICKDYIILIAPTGFLDGKFLDRKNIHKTR